MIPKYRAWDKQYKRMVRVSMILFDSQEIDFEGNLNEPKSMDHFELMQSIGMNDKKGNEIHAGDIIREKFDGEDDAIWQVIWDEEMLAFTDSPGSDEPMGQFGNQNIEIIGNIYQNPELLK